jgi:hypothetical protein
VHWGAHLILGGGARRLSGRRHDIGASTERSWLARHTKFVRSDCLRADAPRLAGPARSAAWVSTNRFVSSATTSFELASHQPRHDASIPS